MSTMAVIPARYASSRFPGKPLALLAGKPMIQWVYERASRACVDRVVVATDDARILESVLAFGGEAVLTSADHRTGTDRVAEVVRDSAADLVVNVQGDEPLIPPEAIDRLVRRMRHTGAPMGTAAVPFDCSGADPGDPNAVKVVLDSEGFALYFSRSLIPHVRQGGVGTAPLHHWGLYAYTREFLFRFVRWPRGPLEQCEMLEQLRALEHGGRILVILENECSLGVDTPEDLARVEALLREMGPGR